VTIGVLVQANFGGTLTVLGVPVPPRPQPAGQAAGERDGQAAGEQGRRPARDQGNSCVIVLATDAPLDSRRLTRVAWRSFAGMARAGSDFSGRSGDYALAFSTAPPQALPLPDSALDPLFVAAADAAEEAILNSLLAAETTAGFRGHVRHAVPLDRVRRLCAARGVLRAGPERRG
jgi:D-aminopeptidase